MFSVRIKTTSFLVLAILCFTVVAHAQDEAAPNPAIVEAVGLFQANKVDEAIAKLSAIIAANPNEEEAHNALGIIYSSRQENDKALEQFSKAISLKERNFKAIFNKLNLLITLNRIDEAEALLVETTQKYSDYANGWVNLGAMQMQRGKFDEALASIDKAIAIEDKDFDAHFKRGQLLLLERRYPEAKASFERSLELEPSFAQAKRGIVMTEDIINKLAQGYIRVRQIIAPSAQAAQNILTKLNAGEDFSRIAMQHSIGPSAKSGGNLGFVKKGELVKQLEDVIFALKVGEVSQVVRTNLGFHIFKREE